MNRSQSIPPEPKFSFRVFLFTVFCLLVLVTITLIFMVIFSEKNIRLRRRLSFIQTKHESLPATFDLPPQGDRNIFFLETLGIVDGQLHLTTRGACAIEAAALVNPSWQVYVNFMNAYHSKEPTMVQLIYLLQKYPNIHMATPSMVQFFEKVTFKDDWAIENNYSVNQARIVSELGRIFLLTEYSGTFMDLDIIARKPFDDLKRNYAVAESHAKVSSSFFNFDRSEIGSSMIEKLWNEAITHANVYQGDEIFTQVFRRECGVIHAFNMTEKHCHGPHTLFSFDIMPIEFEHRMCIFQEFCLEEGLAKINTAYAVKLWSNETSQTSVSIYESSVLNHLGTNYCPRIYSTVEDIW